MKKLINISLAVFVIGLTTQCTPKKKKADAAEVIEQTKSTVYVSNYPLEFFVTQIAGDDVELLNWYKDVEHPVSWEPNEEQINALQGADLVFLNGASFEPWSLMLSLPQSRLVVTTASVEDQLIAEKQTVSHSHGPEGEHEHAISAYTTWLDLGLAHAQAEAVLQALSRLRPDNAATYATNFKTLSSQLLALDEKMSSAAQSWQETRVAFSSPVYQYLQSAYGIKGSSLQWSPDTAPDKNQWHDFSHEQGHHRFKFMIWDSQPLTETLEQLRSKGVETIVFNPCTFPPEQGDFISSMEANVQNLQNANSVQ